MSIIAYLTLTSAKQGVIKGGVTAKGREGTIAVTAVSHEITTPVDQVTGAATGKRKHEPITITMVIDQATPKLYQAAVTNETLTAAKIGFLAAVSRRQRHGSAVFHDHADKCTNHRRYIERA